MLKLLRMALFASLTALGTFIAVPLPYVVVGHPQLPGATEWVYWHALGLGIYTTSAQGIAVAVAGTLLGPVGAFVSQLGYLAMGLVGVPVFADGGGVAYMHTTGFAYLLAFPFAAWLMARVAQTGGTRWRLFGLMAGQVLIMAVGTLYEVTHSGPLAVREAWLTFAWPLIQTLPSQMLAMLPFAVLGGMGDRFRRSLPMAAPPPERTALPLPPESAARTIPPSRQLPGPPKRLELTDGPKHPKRLEGPPTRISLPEEPK